MERRRVLALAATAAFAFAGAAPASAAWPERPITMLVAWGAGGGTDIVTRTFSAMLEKELGVPVAVVNRTGGGGVVGHSAIVNAPPDGYTLGMATMEITVFEPLGLAPINPESFTPIARVAAIPAGLTVSADSPYKTADELMKAIKEKPPGSFKASGVGVGGSWHLAMGGLLKAQGLDPKRVAWVPSQGGAPALQDLMAGGIDVVTASIVESRSVIEAGKVRPLAVMNPQRQTAFPNVPTVKEALGADWSMSTWFAVVGPKGLPADVQKRLVEVSMKIFNSKEFQSFMSERGYVPVGEGPDEFKAFMEKSATELRVLVNDLGIGK
jgi:tripartite-type tricarboxylate transporter receptor subunit TctC